MRYCPSCQRCFRDGVAFCLYDETPTHAAAGLPLVIDDKYQLEGLIAHGGMGSVYRALHVQLERPVAIKILRAEFLADETVRQRFHREALAAARLKHPNIIAVYDFGSLSNGCAYIVMELVEGRSLREELRLLTARHSQMRPERAMVLLQQVCAGVEAAHRHGIIHRDLKPDNIMIETASNLGAGVSERVLVLDFGIAKLKQPEGAVKCLTDEETVIGTPNYISPEQCTGLPVDARSDVYSLGVILYEMLTARVPFSNPSTSAVLLSHLQEPPAPPTRFCTGLSPAVERVVLRALAKSPQHRFGSAAQLAEALTAAVLRAGTEVISIVDWEEPVTRPRQPRVTVEQTAWASEAEEPVPAFDSQAAIFNSDEGEEREVVSVTLDNVATLPDHEPSLLIERRPRRGLFVVVAGLSLVAIGALVDFNSRWLQGSLSRLVQSQSAPAAAKLNEQVAGTQSTPTPEAVAANSMATTGTNEHSATAAETPAATPAPETLVKTSTASHKADQAALLRAQVETFYRRWVQTALDTDWTEHAKFYAERVTYYNEGTQPRAQVVARKRRVLGGLDKYYLRFSGEPQVTFKPDSDPPEAQLTFDKQWDLQRGGQRTAGKSQAQLLLRYENQQWRIVGEKQLRLYHQSASVQHKAVEQKSPTKKLQATPHAKPVARQILPQRKPGAAKPKKK